MPPKAGRMLRQIAAPAAPTVLAAPRAASPRLALPPRALPPRALPPRAPRPRAPRPRAPRSGVPRSRAPLAAVAAAVTLIVAAATVIALVMTNSPGSQTISPAGNAHRTAQSLSSHSAVSHPAVSHSGTSHAAVQPSPAGTSRAPAAPSAPASSPPSPPAASSPASSASGPGGGSAGALPAGYHRFTSSTGFSIGVPEGWQVSRKGHYVYVQDPGNSGIFLLIDQSNHPKPNTLADWKQQQASRASGYPGYHLIRLEPVAYPQAEQAADWEFTYDRDGVLVHILNRNVLANPHHAYALYWSAPASDWDASYHYFQTFAATFQPAP